MILIDVYFMRLQYDYRVLLTRMLNNYLFSFLHLEFELSEGKKVLWLFEIQMSWNQLLFCTFLYMYLEIISQLLYTNFILLFIILAVGSMKICFPGSLHEYCIYYLYYFCIWWLLCCMCDVDILCDFCKDKLLLLSYFENPNASLHLTYRHV